MGKLDGLTILRYGHVYDGAGGMEQYLVDLNRALSERNQLTTIQVQLTSDPARVGEGETAFTLGRVRRVSLFVDQSSHSRAVGGSASNGAGAGLKKFLTEDLLFRPGVEQLVTRPIFGRRKPPRRDGEPADAGRTVRELHARQPINLVCLHSAGGADADDIIRFAQEQRIPVVYVHHFANDRLGSFSLRMQAGAMAGVGGVCGVDVPAWVCGKFTAVADGIDTDFFQRAGAHALNRQFAGPLLFLPARITPTKGQADVVRTAGELKRRGLDCHVALAGRVDTPQYEQEIRRLIAQEQVEDRVTLVGPLDAAGLRDWYAAADLLVFPTRHHEGLPRIVLECQAMELPLVVYNSGGTADGLVDSQTGFLVTPGDFPALVAKVELLLREPATRRAMGQAGRHLVEKKFSLAALAERHESFYAAALPAKGGAR